MPNMPTYAYLLAENSGLRDRLCSRDREIELLRGEIADAHSAQDTQIGLLREEIERLREERGERTKAARHLMVMLGGASDGTPGGWSRKEIRALFNYACEQWPWCDPRKAAEAAGGKA